MKKGASVDPEEKTGPHDNDPKHDLGLGSTYKHVLHKSQVPSRKRWEECSLLFLGPMQKAIMLLVDLGVLLVFLAKVGILRGQDIHGTP